MDRFDLAAIRDRVDLVRVATGMLGQPAKRQGRRLLWRCPFHDDHNPSFQVDPDRRRWDCYVCGIGGDAIELVKRHERVDFSQAKRIAAELSGIMAPSAMERRAPLRPEAVPAAAKAARPLPGRSSGLPPDEASTLVTEAAGRLWTPEGTQALAYLRGRRLSDETIRAARLGWTPGVMLSTRDGDRYYRARGVVIPWFDGERLAKVQIRQPEGSQPKYTEAFRDRPALYPGPELISQGFPLVIAEGVFDRLSLAQELRDLAAVVTLGGAGDSKPAPEILATMLAAAPWFLALDADEAGDKAAANWPPRAIRVRPPKPFKDWTEAAQAGIDLRRWWEDHYLYAAAERQAIQSEQPTPDAELAAFLRLTAHAEEAERLDVHLTHTTPRPIQSEQPTPNRRTLDRPRPPDARSGLNGERDR